MGGRSPERTERMSEGVEVGNGSGALNLGSRRTPSIERRRHAPQGLSQNQFHRHLAIDGSAEVHGKWRYCRE